ncbi:hypothetical protein BpHYR1_040830 [Brachionus plicatilis]|uniref:Uncharacterized protein n=1 Tax=Brachionus plicatilis TaxID=10195 RepID=A0A3M7S083_BRAPC|nr:hypothetical protein BpHYR1_040830 [Brachionus plicatilis]
MLALYLIGNVLTNKLKPMTIKDSGISISEISISKFQSSFHKKINLPDLNSENAIKIVNNCFILQ